jgi:hypothetical protein
MQSSCGTHASHKFGSISIKTYWLLNPTCIQITPHSLSSNMPHDPPSVVLRKVELAKGVDLLAVEPYMYSDHTPFFEVKHAP